MLKRRRISVAQTRTVAAAYSKTPIRLLEVDLLEAMEIAAAHGIHAYDAYLIACARENRCNLISLNKGLLRVARDAQVGVVEVPI